MTKALTNPQRAFASILMTVLCAASLLLAVMPAPARASSLTEPHIQAIVGLLVAFDVDEATIATVDTILRTPQGAVLSASTQAASDDTGLMSTSTTFTASPKSGLAPLSVNFLVANANPQRLYIINFGDGAASGTLTGATQLKADHIYQSAGIYKAKLFRVNSGMVCVVSKPDCNKVVLGAVTIKVASSTANAVLSITADPTTVAKGQTSLITWLAKNVTSGSCAVTVGTSTPFATGESGSQQTAALNRPARFFLRCTDLTNRAVATSTLVAVVSASSTPPGAGTVLGASTEEASANAPSCTLTENKSTVIPGEQVTLTWESTNATYSVSPTGNTAANGSVTVTPTEDTTYQKTVYGPGGSATCQTAVSVDAGAAMQGLLQPDLDLMGAAVVVAQFPFSIAINSLADIFVQLGIGQ